MHPRLLIPDTLYVHDSFLLSSGLDLKLSLISAFCREIFTCLPERSKDHARFSIFGAIMRRQRTGNRIGIDNILFFWSKKKRFCSSLKNKSGHGNS